MPLISRRLLEVRPQEIGKIKLGGRGKQTGTSGGNKMYVPERFDHFEVVTRARKGGDGAFARDEAVHSKVGDEPRELEGILMFPEVEQNLRTVMAHYAGRKPAIVCDGEAQKDMKTGKESPCARITGGKDACPCRPYGRLQLQLRASPHTGGYYVFRTRSWESVNNIQTALEEIHARFGTLFQAPVKLMCYESEDQYTVDGRDKVGRSYKVALVLDVDYDTAAKLMVGAKERLEVVRERLMLTAGEVQRDLDEMDDREAGEIADEFSPPKGLAASVKTQEKLATVVDGLEPVEVEGEIVVDQEPQEEGSVAGSSNGVGETGDGLPGDGSNPPPSGSAPPEGVCPETGEPCEHICEMECFLQDTTPGEGGAPQTDAPVSEAASAPGEGASGEQAALFDEPKPTAWPDPAKMNPIDLKKNIEVYRDSAREMDLLTAEAEEYIANALKKGVRRATAEKVLHRLYEIVKEGFDKGAGA